MLNPFQEKDLAKINKKILSGFILYKLSNKHKIIGRCEQLSQPPQTPPIEKKQDDSVKEIAEALRDATSQLRAIINDLTNPLLRVSLQSQAQQSNIQPQSGNQSRSQQVVNSETIQQTSKNLQSPNEEIELKESIQKIQTEKQPEKIIRKEVIKTGEERREKIETTNVFKLLSLVSDLYMLPKEFFEQAIDAMKSLGYLTQQEADATKKLLNVMIMAGDKGLTPNESLALVALMLNELSGENNELVKDSLSKIVINKLKRQEEVR